jgi:hypothetical protein
MVGELREELPPLDQFREIVAKTNTDDPDKADVAELRRLLGEYPPIVEGGRRPGPPRGI